MYLLLFYPLKGEKKKIVTIDDINQMHISVLQKDSLKLDLEIENLLLKKREISLKIQELEAKKNCNLNLLSSQSSPI